MRIVWVQPRPWSAPRCGADVRTQGLIRCALEMGHEVLVVHPGEVEPGAPDVPPVLSTGTHAGTAAWALSKILSSHPLRAPHPPRPKLRETRRRVDAFAPDIAVVSEVMSWGLADAVIRDETPVLYDAHNVETTLYRRLATDSTSRVDAVTMGVDSRRVARDERCLLLRANVVAAVSDQDAREFRAMGTRAEVVVVPSSVPTPGAAMAPGSTPPNLLFVGLLGYLPNSRAVTELATSVLPAVRAHVPDATLTVVGRGAPTQLRDILTAGPGCSLHDDVADLAPYYASARCVALPIRSGGGTKLKVFEAMAHGLPIVCTTEAARGIALKSGEGVVTDDADEMVSAVTTLLREPAEASRLGAAARSAFLSRLSWDVAARGPLDDALRSVARHS